MTYDKVFEAIKSNLVPKSQYEESQNVKISATSLECC